MNHENPLVAVLEPEEKLLWSGQPTKWLYDSFAFVELLFGVVFLAAGIQVLRLNIRNGPTLAGIVGVTFTLLIAAFLLVGRRWMRSRLRRNTWYGVTNRRLLWITGTWLREGMSMALEPRLPVTIAERSDGTGTLRFGDAPDRECKIVILGFFPVGEKVGLPSFESIQEARAVYDLVVSRQAQLTTDNSGEAGGAAAT